GHRQHDEMTSAKLHRRYSFNGHVRDAAGPTPKHFPPGLDKAALRSQFVQLTMHETSLLANANSLLNCEKFPASRELQAREALRASQWWWAATSRRNLPDQGLIDRVALGRSCNRRFRSATPSRTERDVRFATVGRAEP